MDTGKDIFKVNGIVERDIDLLFLEEFISSGSFRTFFLETTECSPVWQFIKAEVSVVDDTDRESDLVVWFKDNSETKLVFLIENKIGALMQEKQADDYHKRGRHIVEGGDADDYITVLAAPKNYKSEQAGIFNHRIDYEEIHKWFKSSALSNDRKSYKLSLLQSAIDKQGEQSTFQITQPSELVTEFWQDYWNFVLDHAPEFQMKKPGVAGKETTYKYFSRAIGLPDGSVLVHKIRNEEGQKKFEVDYFDLQFSRTSPEQLMKRFEDRVQEGKKNGDIHDSVAIVKADKSASIRVEVPTLDVNKGIYEQLDSCKTAIKRGKELLRYFGNE